MVAHDFRDAQQQASISWVHLAKIFAFVLKDNDAFMEAVKLDLEENYAKTLVKTNVWASSSRKKMPTILHMWKKYIPEVFKTVNSSAAMINQDLK
jgi:hypothetical protein